MTHILSNLPEEYQTIMKILEEKLDDKDDPLSINMICDKITVIFLPNYQMIRTNNFNRI